MTMRIKRKQSLFMSLWLIQTVVFASATVLISPNPLSFKKNGSERQFTLLVTAGTACDLQTDIASSVFNGMVTETTNTCLGQCINSFDATPSCTIGLTPVGGQGPTTLQNMPIITNPNTFNTTFQMAILDIGSLWNQGIVIEISNDGSTGKVAMQTDLSAGIPWGPNQLIGGINETSTAGVNSCDGASDGTCNTFRIFDELTTNNGIPFSTYAGGLCNDFEIDSNGNSPCLGSPCFGEWYLPSRDELNALWALTTFNGGVISGFASDFYWSSTELSVKPQTYAFVRHFGRACTGADVKSRVHRIRCISPFP
jgi:hypothetical protein